MNIFLHAAQVNKITLPPNIQFHQARKIEGFFRKAKHPGLICFPEIFLQEEVKPSTYDAALLPRAKKYFSFLAGKYSLTVVMGSLIEKRGGRFYNTSYIISSDGQILGRYDKQHLDGNERDWITAGKKMKRFSTPFGNLCVLICRDLLYPQCSTDISASDCAVIACPSRWHASCSSFPKEYQKGIAGSCPIEVDALVPARAFETSAAILFANASGTSNYGTLLGKSQIAVPFKGTVARIPDNRQGVLIQEISLSEIRKARKAYGFS